MWRLREALTVTRPEADVELVSLFLLRQVDYMGLGQVYMGDVVGDDCDEELNNESRG